MPRLASSLQIVFGCVDSYQGRHELEVVGRRYLMHYIDIGMDVHGPDPPVIGGQRIIYRNRPLRLGGPLRMPFRHPGAAKKTPESVA
jgi:hypothetical protein